MRGFQNIHLKTQNAVTTVQIDLREVKGNCKNSGKKKIIKAIKEHNIVKINTDTDLRLALTSGARTVLNNNQKEFDPRKYLGAGRDRAQSVVEDNLKVCSP